MAITFYATGSASVANGATTITFAGALLGTAELPTFRAGDLFFDPAQPLVPGQRLASVDYDAGTAELWVNWPGTSMTADPYEVRFTDDGVRSTAQTRRYLEMLGQLAALGIQPNAFGDFADRDAYDDEAEGFIFLSLDGDGATGIWTLYAKLSADEGDWSAGQQIDDSPGPPGAAGAPGAPGSPGATGAAGVSAGLSLAYDSTTAAADPGPGKFRLNNATHASATALYVDNVEALAGADITSLLDSWDDSTATIKGTLKLSAKVNPEIFRIYNVTGSVVNSTGYRTVTIAYVAGAGSLADATTCSVEFSRTGNDGAAGATGSTGAAGAGVTAATSGSPAKIDLAEQTTNGSNKVTVQAPAALASDRVATLPDETGTLLMAVGTTTDNGLPRFDSTAGKLQTSGMVVDDNNDVTGFRKLIGGTNRATWPNEYDMSGVAFPQHRFLMKNGTQTAEFMAGMLTVAGTRDVFFQVLPDSAAGYGYLESWAAAGLIVGTGAAAAGGPISFRPSRTERMRLFDGGGLNVGSPTGGDKGAGTINAVAVYDDNTLLTCMALQEEFLEDGAIDLAKWDAIVPDIVVPEQVIPAQVAREPVTWTRSDLVVLPVVEEVEGRYVRRLVEQTVETQVQEVYAEPVYDEEGRIVDAIETLLFDEVEIEPEVVVPEQVIIREHGTARLFATMVADGFDPRDPAQYIAKLKGDQALPGMPTRADWQHNGLSSGEMLGRLWLATEMLAIVVMNLHDRLSALEAAD